MFSVHRIKSTKNMVVFKCPTVQPGPEQRGKTKELEKPSAGSCTVAFLTLQPCWFTGFCLT